jgi:hypothetical protein
VAFSSDRSQVPNSSYLQNRIHSYLTAAAWISIEIVTRRPFSSPKCYPII